MNVVHEEQLISYVKTICTNKPDANTTNSSSGENLYLQIKEHDLK